MGDGKAIPRLPAASSATVERLFSVVGIAFSDKRKTAKASTLEAIAFTKLNLP